MKTSFNVLRALPAALLAAGLLASMSASAATYRYRIPSPGLIGETAAAAPAAEGSPAEGFWVITADAYNYDIVSKGFATTCPAGGIDPTGPSAVHSPNPAEPYGLDSMEEQAWEPPPSYNYMLSPTFARTWCLPANASDVTTTGSLYPGFDYSAGVVNLSETATPVPADWDKQSNSYAWVFPVTVVANGQPWSMLIANWYTETDNRDTSPINRYYIDGQKLGIRKGPIVLSSFFGVGPVGTFNGVNYQVASGTLRMNPPCAPLATNAPLGTGGPIADIVGNYSTTMILKQDGSVWGTGYQYDGKFGICQASEIHTWRRIATGIASIGMSSGNSYLVKPDGTLLVAGGSDSGEDGAGSARSGRPSTSFGQVASNVRQAGGGSLWSAMLKTDGTLWATGNNSMGEIGLGKDPSVSSVVSWTKVDTGVTSFVADSNSLMWLKGGDLWASGSASNNRMGDSSYLGGFASVNNGYKVQLASDVVTMYGTIYWTAYVKSNGDVYAAGYNGADSQFGQGNFYTYPVYTKLVTPGPVKQIAGDYTIMLLLTVNGDVYAAGRNTGDFGNGTTTSSNAFVKIASGIVRLAGTTKMVDQNGVLWAAGDNGYGGYGDGTTTSVTTFKPIPY